MFLFFLKVLKILCSNDGYAGIRYECHFCCVSADVFIISAVTKLQQLYSDMYEGGLRGLSLGELSYVYWVCRLEHEDCWQDDVTNKCDTITRYVTVSLAMGPWSGK
jgi:hypothetical protein